MGVLKYAPNSRRKTLRVGRMVHFLCTDLRLHPLQRPTAWDRWDLWDGCDTRYDRERRLAQPSVTSKILCAFLRGLCGSKRSYFNASCPVALRNASSSDSAST